MEAQDLSAAEWRDAVVAGLERAGVSFDELRAMASDGVFDTDEQRDLWQLIGQRSSL